MNLLGNVLVLIAAKNSNLDKTTNPVVTRYLNFLRSSSAKAIFERYGFSYLIKPES